MNRILSAAAIVVALAVAGSAAASHQSSTVAVLTLHKTALGKVLATAGPSGRTVYMYTPDAKHTNHCYSGCTGPWQPLISKYKAVAERGVRSWLVGATYLKNGESEVTYNQHPLYLYAGDSKPGQVKGEGRQGLWFALNVSGTKITKRRRH